MVHARRRFLFSAAVVLVIVLLGAGGSFHGRFTPQAAHAVNADANVSFDPVSPIVPADPTNTVNPPRLYAGDLSHVLPARGLDDPLGTNGYCVTLHTGGLTPAGPQSNLGFTLVGADPIDPPNQPATVNVAVPGALRATAVDGAANQGALTGVAGPAVLPTVNGDKYCIVAQAPVGYKTLKVNWTYIDTSAVPHTVILNDPTFIPVVTVTLKGTSIGTAGLVCTVGWDPSFLTGRASEPPPAATPDRLDQVAPPDWALVSVTGGTAVLGTVQRDTTDSTQWCVSVTDTSPIGTPVTVDVSLTFVAVYNRMITTFTTDVVVGDNAIHTVALAPTTLVIPGTFQLAHIGANGQVLTQQLSPALVIGATERACILGSDATDILNPQDINFVQGSGPPDIASVGSLAVFHAGAGLGVPAGTLCFSYSSSSPGEHEINLVFTDTSAATTRTVGWTSGPLIVQWNRIDSTHITTSGTPDGPDVTFGTVPVPVTFNGADGTFIISPVKLTEFVVGSHNAQGQNPPRLLDGVVMQATITGGCGYFVVPDASKPTSVSGTSVSGRFELGPAFGVPAFGDIDGNPDDLTISTANDGGCTPGKTIHVSIDVFYPGSATPAKPTESTDIQLNAFIPPNKTPRLAWVGDTVAITYALSSNTSCAGSIVHFVRPKNQRGSFLASPGVTLVGSDGATGDFGAGCSITVNFISVDPGEVDIEAFTDQSISKSAFPIFYMALEDVTLTDTADTSVVSTTGELDLQVRGWFVGTNPSGHPSKKLPDGRVLPADRWTLPDDWTLLSGDAATGLRGNWGSADMPPTQVTLFMQNEAVVNSFTAGVKVGGLGWFMPYSQDRTVPEVGRLTDANGVVPMPRIFPQLSDLSGIVKVLTFGDKNLSFEGCARSPINRNPLCKPGDIVGHTVYYAVADYIHEVGKYPPIISNTATTEWTTDGYKTVTIVPGETPQYKYVVAHLRDRDGFCDSRAYNNTLGVRVLFQIDAGGGVIIDAQGAPSTIADNRRYATATTFDTLDDDGQAINVDIAKPPADSTNPDECQAWIRVSDSLLGPTNVIVTFSPPPAAVPGDIRITGVTCSVNVASVLLTNAGTKLVSLAGFALRTPPASPVDQENHVGPLGLLGPGQSFATSITLSRGGGANDYVRLVWNGFEIDREYCDGTFSTPPLANPLPPDGEGEIILDAIIPFGQEKEVPLLAGWNLLPGASADTDLAEALAGHEQDVAAVYGWDATNETWLT
jgi:hypothetical protein